MPTVEPGLERSYPGLLLLLASVPTVLSMAISPKATKARPAILGISSWAGVRLLMLDAARDRFLLRPWLQGEVLLGHLWNLLHAGSTDEQLGPGESIRSGHSEEVPVCGLGFGVKLARDCILLPSVLISLSVKCVWLTNHLF